MYLPNKKGSLLLVLLVVSSFLLMAADTPKTDVVVNIEGNNNNLSIELIEKAKEEGIPAMTQEELEMLIKLQMKFLTWQQSQGVDVNVQVNPSPPIETKEKPVNPDTIDEANESQSTDTTDEEEGMPNIVALILLLAVLLLALYLLFSIFLW